MKADSLPRLDNRVDRHRILLVDDDRLGTNIRAEVLRLHGLQVEIAYSGTEALARKDLREFAAIVVDYDMPDMNGIQLAVHFHQQGCSVPVVMLSGRLQPPTEPGAELLAGFISKGEQSEALFSTLTDMIQGQKMQVSMPRARPSAGA